MKPCRARRFPALLLLLLAGFSCTQNAPQAMEPAGTPELRAALFDSILAKTARRGAFSVPKEEALGYDPLGEMEELRAKVVGADTEDDLYYALVRLRNARRDRHLSVELVEGGIRPAFTDGLPVFTGDESTPPVRPRSGLGPISPPEAISCRMWPRGMQPPSGSNPGIESWP